MRTFMLFLLATFTLISCDDIQDNSPALQAELNDELYRAIDARAEIKPNGTLVLQGLTDMENLTITLNGSTEGVYSLGGESSNRAAFQDFLGSVYTTNPYGDGEVIIESTEGNTFTGSFLFNAYRFGLDTLNVQKGYFFKVPIIEGSTTEEPEPPVSIFTATINGNPFSAETISATDSNGLIAVNGTNDTQTLTLSFPNSLSGVNNPIEGDISASYILDGETLDAVAGTLSIVNHDTTLDEISGTFSFETEGPEGTEVTEGQFNVVY